MSSPFIAAYWSRREEPANSCATRLAILISKIGARHPLLQGWKKKGRSRTEAQSEPIGVSAEEIVKLFKTNNDEIKGSAILELGFNISLWNGNDNHGIALSATCGAFADCMTNSVVLHLPPGHDENVLEGVDLKLLVQDFVDALDPDFAMLTSSDYINRNGGGAPWDVGGWVNYNPETGRIVKK